MSTHNQPQDLKGIGESSRRVFDKSKGIVSESRPKKDDGGHSDPVKADREAHVLSKRRESEKTFDDARQSANSQWRKKVATHKRMAGHRPDRA